MRFHCVATDVVAGDEAWFDRGPLVDAVLASAAMPGMFPSVEIDGHRYVDGAVVNDIPITRAVELGARQIYVLEASPLSQSWSEPRRPLEAVLQAYWIARRNRFQRDLDSLADDIEVHVLGDGQPPTPPLHDLGRSAAMIHSAYMASAASLGQDKDPRGQKPSGRSGRSGGPNGQEPAGE